MTLEDYRSKIKELNYFKSMVNKDFFESNTKLRVGDTVKALDDDGIQIKSDIISYEVLYDGSIFVTLRDNPHRNHNIKNVEKCIIRKRK